MNEPLANSPVPIEILAAGPEPDRLPFVFVEGEALPEATDMSRLVALGCAASASVVESSQVFALAWLQQATTPAQLELHRRLLSCQTLRNSVDAS